MKLAVLLIVSMGTVASYTTPSPCTVSTTWKDKYNNNCNAYQTKSWCVSDRGKSQFQVEVISLDLTPTLSSILTEKWHGVYRLCSLPDGLWQNHSLVSNAIYFQQLSYQTVSLSFY